MRYFSILLMLVCISFAQAQLTVESFTPANNATNVPLTTSISVTFSAALDTTYHMGSNAGIFSNVERPLAQHYSPDLRTLTFDVELSPSMVYIVCFYFARGLGGATLQTPVGFMFTTASSFPAYSVSGNVLSGSSGVSPANALVLLSTTPATGGEPTPVSGAIADGAGGYVLPHVPNGTYYPIAAKDVDANGTIDPTNGDVVALGEPVTVNNANLTGVDLTFSSVPRMSLSAAIILADSISATLPSDKSLRYLRGEGVDTAGKAKDWEFLYLRTSGTEGYRLRLGYMEQRNEPLDGNTCSWLINGRPLVNPGSAANPSIFLANVENAGGREFRSQTPGSNLSFDSQVNLGDLSITSFGSLITDPSQDYWGARYSFGYDSSNQWVQVSTKMFIGNYSTGAILLVTDVKADGKSDLPSEFALSQNYPNPFNPSTQIRFSVSKEEWTTLKVYNLIGQEVATLVQGRVPAGQYRVQFDGGHLASGVYLYRLASGTHTLTNKMVLVK